MNNYYFTFGQNHTDINGYPLANYWVRVVAKNYNKARELFIENFSSQYLEKPDKWSFQYEEDDFKADCFPNGELTFFAEEI